ncbi:MAG TPA: U32 family peptidase, partial [Bacilli bacterium]|nr:U32 family peptidase [Bacilli bacterium]
MTKLIVDLKSLWKINNYQADGFILNDPDFSCFPENEFSLEQITNIIYQLKRKNKLVFINVDRIIEEEELNILHNRLKWYLTFEIDYFIYGDFAVFSYLHELNPQQKLIYNSQTLITNDFDARFYHHLHQLVMISNELNFDEIKQISLVGNGVMEVYGFHQIFYSRRQLLSTFQKYKKIQYSFSNRRLDLQEEQRNERYSIFEAAKGTFIYTPYRYCLFKELNELKNHLVFIKISGAFIDQAQLLAITKL